jgi:diacylglycerol kinase family enzyme
MNIRIIINPISGTDAARKRAKKVVLALEEEFKIKGIKTEYAGHATELAKQAVNDGVEIVVAVGGDGTVNEIASALVGTETALIIVGTGSGNGLARDLGMFGLSTKQIIKRIKENKSYRIDCGEVLGRKFFCTCGSGFDALIGHLFAQTKVRGFLTYVKLSLKAYKDYTPLSYRLSFGDNSSCGSDVSCADEVADPCLNSKNGEAFVVNIANNKQFGNNAYIAPHANLMDGLFTVTIIKPFKWYNIPYMAYSLFFKQMHKNKFVETFDCGDCILDVAVGAYLHIDGEPINTNSNSFSVKMIPASLKII